MNHSNNKRSEPLPRATLHELKKRALAPSPSTPLQARSSTAAASTSAITASNVSNDNSEDELDDNRARSDNEVSSDNSERELEHPAAGDNGVSDNLDEGDEDLTPGNHGEPTTEDMPSSAEESPPPSDGNSSPFLLEFTTLLGNGSSMSVGDALVLLMDISIKHCFSWTAIEDVLKFSNIVLGREALPESKYLFRKFAGASPEDMNFHFYCPTCEHPLVKTTGKVAERNSVSTMCAVCGKQYTGQNLVSNGNFFVSLPLEKQFASILADDGVRNQLLRSLEHRTKPQNGMSDITDGAFYKDQRQKLRCKKDLTLTMSTDGSPVFKSSTYSIWPVHVVLNELPPYLRWSNMMLSLLWYGSKHPNMTLLLQAFAEQMKRLSVDGIAWNAGGRELQSKVYCITSVADAPARASMQNVLQYNGYYGCGWCLHPGLCVEGCVKYPMTVGMINDDRDHPSMLEDMKTAAMTKRTVHGVKGPSPLLNVPGFDIVWSFRPDYMHCALLGVVRQLTDLWFSDVGKEYYIGAPSTAAEVDSRLLSQKPHQCFNRPPRSVKLRKYSKAVEWESWHIYYALPWLRSILPRQYLEHFALLACALYDLMKSVVTKQDVDGSTERITRFVVMTQYLYGEAQMTSNVHTLLHIAKSVLLHGPLWALSCFEFESNMGQLLKLVSSAKGIPNQILSRIFFRNSFRQLHSMASEEVKELCSQMTRKKDSGVKLLGKAKAAPQDVSNLLQEDLGAVHGVEEYNRVRVSGCTIHREQYKSPLKRDSTAVKIGTEYTKAERILSVRKADGTQEGYVLSYVYDIDNFDDVGHQKFGRKTVSKQFHLLTEAVRPCMHLNMSNRVVFAQLCDRHGWS